MGPASKKYLRSLVGFSKLNLCLNPEFIANHQMTRFSNGTPLQSVILKVYLARKRKAGFGISPRILDNTAKFLIQTDRLRNIPERKIAFKHVNIPTCRLQLSACKPDFREFLTGKEVIGLQMAITLFVSGSE